MVWQAKAGPAPQNSALSSRAAQRIFDACAALNLHLALVQLPEAMFTGNSGIGRIGAAPETMVTCLRSVLMKPEHEQWLDEIWERLTLATSRELAGSRL